jgi:hypothetical protein
MFRIRIRWIRNELVFRIRIHNYENPIPEPFHFIMSCKFKLPLLINIKQYLRTFLSHRKVRQNPAVLDLSLNKFRIDQDPAEPEPEFSNFYGAQESASLTSLAGQYVNPIPTRFLPP